MEAPDAESIKKNQQILSTTDSVGPLSFCDSRQEYNDLAPPPKYFSDEALGKIFKQPVDYAAIMR